jgi:hypothetical protein
MAREADPSKWREWERRLREYEEGDSTVENFCRRVGVSSATFMNGSGSLAGGRAPQRRTARPNVKVPKASEGVSFVPLQITGRPSIEVHLANGAKVLVPVHDPEAIRTVIGALMSDRAEGGSC